MFRQVALGCLIVLLAVSGLTTTSGAEYADQSAILSQPEGFDQTTFEITMYENGSARWSVNHHQRLENDTEVEQFEDFAEEFRTNETDLYRNFVTRAEKLTDVGTNATGRSMTAKSFSRDAYTNVTTSFNDRGTIELTFTWTQFAQTDGSRVIVGDVFGDNFYIGSNQALVFHRGSTLQFVEIDPEPTSQTVPDSLAQSETVSWEGEQQFAQQRPYLVLSPQNESTGTATATQSGETGTETKDTGTTARGTDGTQTNGTATPLDSSTGNSMLWVIGAVIIVLGLSGAFAYRSGSISFPDGASDTGGAVVDQEATDEQASEEPQPAVSDEELLSDSDRVLQLLENNGGRMKQVNIVDETDWSKSKVSMLLSDMEDEGDISKLRVGRENIISLSGEEPDAAGSPFDEDE